MTTPDLRKGYLLGLVTFGIWGMFPLYFKSIEQFGALEIVTQRAIWSALFGTLVLLVWRHPAGCASCSNTRGASACWRSPACSSPATG